MSRDEGNEVDEGQDEGLDEGEDISDADRVTLVDEEGNETEFVLLAVIDVEGQDYALLAPEGQLGDDGDSIELFIFQYDVDEDGEEAFSPVDEDGRYEEVRDLFAQLMDLEDGDAEGDEDGDDAPTDA
jgi:uncharacterized protein YrzB (UPF0473 family)